MSAEPKVFRIGAVQNAVVSGKRFKARLIKDGPISYTDVKQGVAYVSRETLDRCVNTFIGTPITLKHKTVTNAIKQKECSDNGEIDGVYYEPSDGWFWCEGPVNGDAARARINSVGKVSCGYNVTSLGPKGKLNCIPYDYEITGFIGEHLAIEEMPRYTGSKIILNSQNQPTPTNMFKWFRKDNKPNAEPDAAALLAKQQADAAAAAEAAKLNAQAPVAEEISGDTEIMVGEEKVKISDLTTGYSAHKANAIATEGQLPEGASLDVDGVQVPVADLIAAHKLNAQAEAKRQAQPKVFKIVNARTESDAAPVSVPITDGGLNAAVARGKAQF